MVDQALLLIEQERWALKMVKAFEMNTTRYPLPTYLPNHHPTNFRL